MNSNFNWSRPKWTVIPNGSMKNVNGDKGLKITAPLTGSGLPFHSLDVLWKWTVFNKKVFSQYGKPW